MILMIKFLPNLFVKRAKTFRNYSLKSKEWLEVKIPVSWGHIGGKWWGNKNKRPIVALHGWQDNAGSFDTLIPLLKTETPILALDSPGHGFSSRLPPGVIYYGLDLLRCLYEIMKYFEWPQISLLGHSMGAITSSIFSAVFPNKVEFAICIDNLKPFLSQENSSDFMFMLNSIESFEKYNLQSLDKKEPPSYTWEECEKLIFEGSHGSISLESSKYLLKRNVLQSKNNPNKFYFTRDPRLKAISIMPFTQKQCLEYFKDIKCPLLFLKAENSSYYDKKENVMEVLDVIKKSSRDCQHYTFPGKHHVHLNNPEVVERYINEFIKKHDTTDRTCKIREEIFIK